ncbi:uncharacterized protein LOC123551492 isoform X2 [Mercenaria mercenaria]|uniref:uncharacterized protein LOC123551492 isoform X2 n=1 Tax=Mercenaria mercenaria TaxID=6596 RepID=UPI00234F2C69|nr:uncharacterized protein LOC123551492 isoform X2 [Mercenaria mercenaria]
MDLLEHCFHWFIVDIPENTTREISLQRIMTLSEKSRNNARIFLHYEDGRAFFKFLDGCSTFNEIEATELINDPEIHDVFVLQYSKQILVCKNAEGLIKSCFPKGMERRIEYKSLPEMVQQKSGKSEVIRSEPVNDVCLEDRVISCKNDKVNYVQKHSVVGVVCNQMISVKTGESLPDNQADTKYKRIKFGDSTRCKPARIYILSNKVLEENEHARQDIEQILSVYIKNVAKTSDGGTAATNTLALTDKVIKEDKMVLNEAKQTEKRTVTKFSLNSDALNEARDCSANISEDIRQMGLDKEMKNYMRHTDAFLLAAKQSKNSSRTMNFSNETELTFKETTKKRFIKTKEHKKSVSDQEDEVYKESAKSSRQKKASASRQASKRRKRSRHYVGKPLNNWKGKVKCYVGKRLNHQEIVKRRQKKPFRSKGWSWNSDENLKQKYILDENECSMLSFKESSYKYSKDIIKLLREFTDLLHHERSWKVTAYVYPYRRGKLSKSSQRRNQQSRTHASQAAEGIQDQHPTQVSDAASENLNLPPAELVQTSARSIFQTFTNNSPAPTTNLMVSIDAERSLVNRLQGVLPENRFSRPQQPPRHQQYSDQPARLRSFSNWPSTAGQDPSRMAVYGFFYTGRFDLIRCFQCGIGLKDWAAPDEPLFEHIKHSPDCQFLKDLLGQDLLNAYRDNLLANQLRQATATSGSSTGNQTQATGRIRNPQYSEATARLRSFDKWPASSLQRPQALVDAGLFYTGFNDLCRCFTCDGGLQRWDADDDPWIEHARWFPHCNYVRQIKGQEYINMVQQAAAQAREEEQDPAVVYPPPGQRAGRGPVEQGISDLTLEDTNPLNTLAAQSVIGMGYSRRAVLLAIHEYNGQAHGERDDYTAGDLVRILTERQDRGEALPPDSPRDSYATPANVLIPENMGKYSLTYTVK